MFHVYSGQEQVQQYKKNYGNAGEMKQRGQWILTWQQKNMESWKGTK